MKFQKHVKVPNLELQFVIWRVFRLEATVRRFLSSYSPMYVLQNNRGSSKGFFFGDSFSVWGRGCSWTLAKDLKSRSISFDSIVLVIFFSFFFLTNIMIRDRKVNWYKSCLDLRHDFTANFISTKKLVNRTEPGIPSFDLIKIFFLSVWVHGGWWLLWSLFLRYQIVSRDSCQKTR